MQLKFLTIEYLYLIFDTNNSQQKNYSIDNLSCKSKNLIYLI